MYRKDVFDAEGPHHAGASRPGSRSPTSPPRSTAPQPGMKGICLRGLPGWGEVFAPLTTVVNTFGGTWFDKDWNAAGQRAGVQGGHATSTSTWCATHGEAGAAAGRLHRVPEQHRARARSRCGTTPPPPPGRSRPPDSPVAGQDRLRRRRRWRRPRAPAGCTPGPGRSRRPPRSRTTPGSSSPGPSSKKYEELVGAQARLVARCPPASGPRPTRTRSTRRPPAVRRDRPLQAIESADPNNPGVQPRPAIGIQFVDIPEFPDLGTKVSQDVSAAIAGQRTVDEALDKGQKLAEDVAEQVPGRVHGRATRTAGHHGYRTGRVTGKQERHDVPPPDRIAGSSAARPPAGSDRPAASAGRGAAPLLPALIFIDHRHPAAVRGDADHLVHELERLLPGRDAASPGSTTTSTVFTDPDLRARDLHHHRAHRRRVVVVSLRARPGPRAAAGPQVPRPRRRPHPADRARS